MNRIVLVAGLAVAVVAVVVGVQISGKLGNMQAQLEKEADLLDSALGSGDGGQAGGAANEALVKSLEHVASNLQELLSERAESGAVSGGLTSQSMAEAALMLTYSPDPTLRQHTIAILGQLGGEKAEERLIEMMEADRSTQSHVLQALKAMGSAKLNAMVLDMLENGPMEEKRVAAGALGEILNSKNVPVVLEVLASLPSGNNSQGNSLRRQIYNAFQRSGYPEACRPLMNAALLETDDYTRREAFQAMAACSTPAQIPVLIEALQVLGPGLSGHSSSSSHQQIISQLGQMGDPRVTPYILTYLDSTNRSIVQQAVQALRQLNDPYAASRIVEVVNGPKSYAKDYMENYIRNGYAGIRKGDDGKFVLEDEKTMERLMANRQKVVARLKERYGPLQRKDADVQPVEEEGEAGEEAVDVAVEAGDGGEEAVDVAVEAGEDDE